MFVYKVISKNHYSPETGAYISFGISAHDPEHGQILLRSRCVHRRVGSTRLYRTPEYASGVAYPFDRCDRGRIGRLTRSLHKNAQLRGQRANCMHNADVFGRDFVSQFRDFLILIAAQRLATVLRSSFPAV